MGCLQDAVFLRSSVCRRSLTRLEGRVAVLDRPVLADFLRAVVGKGQPQGARREAGKPPADTKLYIEVSRTVYCRESHARRPKL